jgi:hypothetical protein
MQSRLPLAHFLPPSTGDKLLAGGTPSRTFRQNWHGFNHGPPLAGLAHAGPGRRDF